MISSSSVNGSSLDRLTYLNKKFSRCNKRPLFEFSRPIETKTSYSTLALIVLVLLDGAFLSIHNVEAMKFQDKHKEKCQLSANNFNV
ncbi:unnamed protein product [Camellia sinensis]